MGRAEAPLVGREGERAALSTALEEAADAPLLVLLTGEAGIGKSRLCADLLSAAREQGWRCLTGHAVPLSSGELPWAPWTELLRALGRSEGRGTLSRLIADDAEALAPVLPLRAVGAAGPVPTAAVLEALLALVERLAAERPLVLALEDLHWADPLSLDALAFLVRNLADAPVLLVATARTDEPSDRLRAVLAELRRDDRARSVALPPLDADGTAALLEALGADPAGAPALLARTGGNPYYLRELVAAGDRPVTHLQDAVLARLDGLPPSARTALSALAVAGRPTGAALLAAVTGLADEPLAAALRALDGRRLLATVGDGHAPAHDLAASAVLDALLPEERRRLHERYAEALDTDPSLLGDPLGALLARAEHRAGAGRPAPLLSAAAAVALAPAAGPQAVARWGRQALTAWDSVADAPAVARSSRGALLAATAEALLETGHPGEAVELLQQALDEPDAADPQIAGERLERLAECLWSSGRTDEAEQSDARALALLSGRPSPALAAAQASAASTLMVLGRWAEAEELCREGLATAQATGTRAKEAHLLATLGVVLVSVGRHDEGLDALERSCDLARATGDVRLLWRNLMNLAYGLETAARTARAAEVGLQALQLARRHGRDDSDVRGGVANAVSPLVDLGRWHEAAELLATAPAGSPADPRVRRLARVEAALAVEQGRSVDEAVLAGDEPEPATRQQRDEVVAARALWAGAPLVARAAVASALEVEGSTADRARLLALDLRALADRLAVPAGVGGPDGAERADLLRQVDQRLAQLPDGGAAEQAFALQARAEAARARGTDDPTAWQRAVEAWDALDRPYAAALARWRLAEAAPDRATAEAGLRSAYDVAVRLEAAPLRRELELLALRRRIELAGAPAVPAQAGPLDALALTARERQVLELLSTGASNRRISRELHITESTAGVHVSNVLRKLGVANRTEATAVAHRLGLAPTPGGNA